MINIAIDGPAGSGKSTLAKWIANHYHYQLIDTGAMYRSVAYLAHQKHIPLLDEKNLITLCKNLQFSFTLEANLKIQVLVNGEDFTDCIRRQEVSMATSEISKLKGLRKAMVEKQRTLAQQKGVVMEGRDIGSVVLKDAELKFYITASIEVRAKRRLADLEAAGSSLPINEIIESIRKRDQQDLSREHSPLRQTEDAILIDTSDTVVQEAFDLIKSTIDQKLTEKIKG